MNVKSISDLVSPVFVDISKIMRRVEGIAANLDSFTIRLVVPKSPSDILLETYRSTINNLVREAESGVNRVGVTRSPTSTTTLLFTVYPKETEVLTPDALIWRLGVSRRTISTLAKQGVVTIQDALDLGAREILDLWDMGETSVHELRKQLELFGYELTRDGNQE